MDKNQLAISTYNKIAPIYTDKYFRDISDLTYIDNFTTLLPDKAKVLDAGCGPGQHVKYLLDKGYELVGIDLSEKMIQIAKQKVPNGNFQIMDMRHTSFENQSFDAILSAYSLIHIPTAEVVSTLNEFSRILKPKGYVLIMVQKGESDKVVSEPLKNDELMFFNFFTIEKLTKLLHEAKYNIIYTKEVRLPDKSAGSDTAIYLFAQKID